jgi:hypothetical protein
MTRTRVRDWLLSLLIATPALGKMTSINFVSMETYRGPERGFELTLADLITWSLIAILVMRHRTRLVWIPHNTFVLALLFALAVVSTAGSEVPLYGTFTLFKLLRMYLVYWCVTNLIVVGVPLDQVWYGLIVIAANMTFLAVKQKYLMGYYRIPGPFDHSNTIPLFVNMLVPALLVWGLADKRLKGWQVTASLIGVCGLAFSVVATMSRAGMALMGAALMLSLLSANLGGGGRRARFASIGVILVLVAGGIKASASILDRIANAPKASEEARDEFNAAADLMLADHTLGVGLNNFSHVLTTEARYNAFIHVMKNESQAGVCHHIYRLTGAEMGKIGLSVFVLAMLRFTWRPFRYAWRAAPLERLLLLTFGFGLITLSLSGFLEWAFRLTPVMQTTAVVAGITGGLSELARRRRPAARLA